MSLFTQLKTSATRYCTVKIVIFAAISMLLTGCGGKTNTAEKYQWPTEGLALQVNKPSSDYGDIYTDGSTAFGMNIYQFGQDDFSDYVSDCKARGFTIEAKERDAYFCAYNSEGYKITLNYNAKDEKLQLTINAPMELAEISWPTTGITQVIPKPEFRNGKIVDDLSDNFFGYIGGMPIEAFGEYVQSCVDAGFDQNASQTETTYRADNADGIHLELIYKGFEVVSIGVKREAVEQPNETETITVEEPEVDADKLYDLVGADVFTAGQIMTDLEYTPTYYYDYPNPDIVADYTNTIATMDEEFLQQLFITRVESVDAASKTVVLYVNDTNPNVDVERTSTVSFDMACQTVENYGKQQFPYGFTLHYITGMIANQTYADGTVMIKAECTIKNALGIKVETVCEAKVTGTDDYPVVSYFFVYD